ncbi:MAG: hypothetical protein GX802_01125 [Clostridiales bacterium]|nr:hypothetical protein [Clostridiales bacterium]
MKSPSAVKSVLRTGEIFFLRKNVKYACGVLRAANGFVDFVGALPKGDGWARLLFLKEGSRATAVTKEQG